jgi:hypothetical protein
VTRCPWWRAWWHRRLRRIDRATLWPVIRRRAAAQMPDHEEEAVLLALRAWLAFISAPGQEHWRCACAAHDQDPE